MSDSSGPSKTYLALYDTSTTPSTLVKEWNSEQSSLSIGRGKESEAKDLSTGSFRSDKTKVMSAQHAKLVWINDQFTLVDTESTNGTYINRGEGEGTVRLAHNVPYVISDRTTVTFGRKVTSSRPGLSGEPLVLLARISKSSSLDQVSQQPYDKQSFKGTEASQTQHQVQRRSTLSDRRSPEIDSDEDLDDVLGSSDNDMLPASTLAASRLPTCASSSSGRRGFGLSEEDLLATSSQDEEVSEDVESVSKTKSYFDYIGSRQFNKKKYGRRASSSPREQDVDLSLRDDSDARSPFSSRLPSPISPDQLPSRTTEALDLSKPRFVTSDDDLEDDHDYFLPPSGSQSGIFSSQSIVSANSRLASFQKHQPSLPPSKSHLPSKIDDDCEDAFSQASHLPSPQLSACSSLEVDLEEDTSDYRSAAISSEETTIVKVEEIDQAAEAIPSEEDLLAIIREDDGSSGEAQTSSSPGSNDFDETMEQLSQDRAAFDDHLESTRKIDCNHKEDLLDMGQSEPESEEEQGSEAEIESQVEMDTSEVDQSESDVRAESVQVEDEEEGFWVDGGKATNEFEEQEEIDEDGIDWQDPKPNGPTHADLTIKVEKGLHEAEIDRDYEDAPLEYDGQPFGVDLDLDGTAHEVDSYADGDPDVDEVDPEEEKTMRRMDEGEGEGKEDKEGIVESEEEEEIEILVEEVKDNIGVRAISPELKEPRISSIDPEELAVPVKDFETDTSSLGDGTVSALSTVGTSTTSLKRRLSDTDFEEDSDDGLDDLDVDNIPTAAKRRRISSHIVTFAVGILSGAFGLIAGLSQLGARDLDFA